MDWRLKIRIKISILIRILKNISTTATIKDTMYTRTAWYSLYGSLSIYDFVCLCVCIDEDKVKYIKTWIRYYKNHNNHFNFHKHTHH